MEKSARRFVQRGMWSTIATWGVALVLSPPAFASHAIEQPSRPEMIEAYMNATGVSVAEATHRMDLQRRGQDLAQVISERLGERYSGLWFDDATGRFKIALTDDSTYAEVAEAIRQRGLDPYTDGVKVKHSLLELEAERDRLNADVSDLVLDGVASTSIQPSANSVVLTVSETADLVTQSRAEVRSRSGRARITMRKTKAIRLRPQPATCQFIQGPWANRVVDGHTMSGNCNRPLRGGVRIYEGFDPETGGICSMGFLAQSRVSTNRYILTAGHCGPANATWSAWHISTGQMWIIGTSSAVNFGTNGDSQRISLSNSSPWRTAPNHAEIVLWTGWPPTAWAEHWAIRGTSDPFESQIVCHSGGTRGSGCSRVSNELDITVNVGGTMTGHLTRTDWTQGQCVAPGDSGGPFASDDRAVGLTSAFVYVGPGDCDEYFYSARRAENAANVNILFTP